MYKRMTKAVFIICLSALQLCLSGCQNNISVESSQAPIETPAITPETTVEVVVNTESPVPEVSTKSLTISALNLSNVDIGMFAVIDPVTGEQVNIDSLAPGESVSLESNWPTDTEEFHWALYNQAGELCVDASTNISEAQKTVALLLTGKDTIENVEVLSE